MIYWLILLSHILLVGGSWPVTHYAKIKPRPHTVRITKPPPTTTTHPIMTFIPNCWTQWFDRDDPTSTGDWETLPELRAEYPGKICDKPLQIEVQTIHGTPAASTGDIFFLCDVVSGFVCRNADQKGGCKCEDYKVRFLCSYSFCYHPYPDWTQSQTPVWPSETQRPPSPTTTPTTQPIDYSTVPYIPEWTPTTKRNHFEEETTTSRPKTTRQTYFTRPPFTYTKPIDPWWPTERPPFTVQHETKTTPYQTTTRPKTTSWPIYTKPIDPWWPTERPPFTKPIDPWWPTERPPFTVQHETKTTPYHMITRPKTTSWPIYTKPIDPWWPTKRPPFTVQHETKTTPYQTTTRPKTTSWPIYTKPIDPWWPTERPPFTKPIDPWWPTERPPFTVQHETKTTPYHMITRPKTTSWPIYTKSIDPLWSTERPPFTVQHETKTTPPINPETKTIFVTRPPIATKPFVCWTLWFDRDDPSGTGDWETLSDLRKEHPGQICPKPLQIEVLTTAGQPVSSTGDVIFKSDTVTGFVCRNSDQNKKGQCSDYKVRFMCPHDFCTEPQQCWTKWFDRDDPTVTGDWETLIDLRTENPGMICNNPLQIQVQTITGVPMTSTGDVIYKADTVTGFICRNSDQTIKRRCQDYRVRFMCPLKFCAQARCWTRWFDRDDPTETGDWETLAALRNEYPEQICDNPLQIEAKTTTGLPVAATGNIIAAMDTTVGFICKNADQKKRRCYDFQVRFLCPPDFCRPKECHTEWFDRDDPSGSGDWETLPALRAENPGMICNNPLQIEVQTTSGNSVASTGNVISVADVITGFVCKNAAQPSGVCQDFRVRFLCPPEFCQQKVCWTRWYDRDDPTATGDWELLSDLRPQYPNEICDTPLYIQAVTVDTNTPVTATGQAVYIYSPTQGFACRNQDQKGCQCRDYKVRFGCPCCQGNSL